MSVHRYTCTHTLSCTGLRCILGIPHSLILLAAASTIDVVIPLVLSAAVIKGQRQDIHGYLQTSLVPTTACHMSMYIGTSRGHGGDHVINKNLLISLKLVPSPLIRSDDGREKSMKKTILMKHKTRPLTV